MVNFLKETSSEVQPVKKKNHYKMIAIIVASVLVVVIIVTIVLFLTLGGGKAPVPQLNASADKLGPIIIAEGPKRFPCANGYPSNFCSE